MEFITRIGSLAVLVTIMVVSTCFTKTEAAKCGPNEHSLNGQRCCTECPPGQGVLQVCTPQNDTKCQSCTFGESYSIEYSHVETCRPCSICPEYAHMTQPCNMTHDTMCQCDRNYFFDMSSQRCRPCQLCPLEYGVRRKCNLTHDTVCARCSDGLYSDRLNMEPCKTCSICVANQVMIQHCSPGLNTICIDIPAMHSTPVSPPDSFTHAPSSDQFASGTNPIPIYCSILGAIILALIIYVIIKQNQRRQLNKKGLSSSHSTESPPLLSGAPSMTSGGVFGKQGSDSGVYVELDRPVTNTTKIRDLPAMKRKALENSMHGGIPEQGGWKMLARELGFSTPMISSVETRAHQDGFSPLRILLSEWGKRDNAQVGTLVNALRAIRRQDCVRILCGDTREYIGPPKYFDLQQQMHTQQVL